MNDFFGPRAPSATQVESGTPRTERAQRPSAVNRQQDNAPTSDQGNPDNRRASQRNQRDLDHQRDPAVSIAARTAHLVIGETIETQVSARDAEGRPLLKTAKHDYAILSKTDLAIGDKINLKITEIEREISASLIKLNDKAVQLADDLSLQIIAVHKAAGATDTSAAGDALAAQPTAYGPPPTAIADTNISDKQSLISAFSNQTSTATPTLSAAAFSPAAELSPTGAPTSTAQTTLLAVNQAAFQADGTPVTLTLASSAVLRLAPQQSTIVTAIKALTIADARRYNLPAVALAHASGPPSLIETQNRGAFVVTAQVSEALVGKPILVQPVTGPSDRAALSNNAGAKATATAETDQSVRPQTPANAGPTATAPQTFSDGSVRNLAQHFSAKLLTSDGHSTTIDLSFPTTAHNRSGSAEGQANQAVALGSIPITKVQILATRPSPQGPLATHRITTAIGTAEVDLPGPVRPRAGDFVFIGGLDEEARADNASAAAQAPLSAPVSLATPPRLDALDAATEHLSALAAGQTVGHPRTDADQIAPQALQAAAAQALSDITAHSTDGGSKLTNSILFFMAAMGAKKADALVGDTAARLLARAHTSASVAGRPGPSMLDGVLREIRQLFQAARADKPAGDWRSFTLPFDVRDAHINPLHMVVRDVTDNSDEQAGQQPAADQPTHKKQQFIIAVDFKVLGPVQLQGMIIDKDFDLALASKAKLTPGLRNDLSGLFAAAVSANGFSGQLRFLTHQDFADIADIMIQAQA